MKYNEFLAKMSQFAQGFTLRDEIGLIDSTLLQDIPEAKFFDEFSNMFGAEIEQGQSF
jgi:hypothetical protein